MSTHTPGPWIDQRTGLILSADGDVIADFVRPEDRPVIAAAPELLAACKTALGAFEHNHAIDWSELERAIAKAEGR